MTINCICGKKTKEIKKNQDGTTYICSFCGTEIFIPNEQERKNNKKE